MCIKIRRLRERFSGAGMMWGASPSKVSLQFRCCISGIASHSRSKGKILMQRVEQENYLDISSPVKISDPGIHEQVVRYRSWLAAQAVADPSVDMQVRQEYA